MCWYGAVMRQVPRSHIWMIRIHSRDAEHNLKARASSLGISPDRIHVVQVACFCPWPMSVLQENLHLPSPSLHAS